MRDAATFVNARRTPLDPEGTGLYRLLVESVTDYAIFALSTEGVILSWNNGARRIKGYEGHEIIGRHINLFYPPQDQQAGKAASLLRKAAEDGHVEDLGWRVRKDGTRFWASVVITALHGEGGELVGYAKVTRDLTERMLAQERAIADAKRIATAEASSRAKTEFLAAMSHELRTPLNAIGGFVELLQMGIGGELSAQQREYLERVRAAQQHLLALINDLLNYSRIESGHVDYDIAPIPLNAIVEKVVALVEGQAAHRQVRARAERDAAEVVGLGDRVKVEQIVLNLMSNAVKFTPAGGQVVGRCVRDEDASLVIVEDSGPGVPEDQREAIFEPFVQLGRSLTSTQEGTGLGLAISRDLARAMGGDITVSTGELGGAQFTLRLKTA